MTLHFDPARVQRLIDHTLAAQEHADLYGDPETKKPGLWLVGDQGVYLMSNGVPFLPAAGVRRGLRASSGGWKCQIEPGGD